MRDPILLLKVFQFPTERAPVVVAEARVRESHVPASVSPLAVEINPILLLKVFQSPTERAPVTDEVAMFIPNTPVRLLYVSGQFAERDVSPILVATTPERVARFPERVAMFPVAVERFVFVVERLFVSPRMFPVAVARFEFVVERFVVRVEMFPVAVAMLLLMIERDPERAFCARGIVK